MTTVPELQAQIAALQLKINVLQSVGEDTFPLNTIAQFNFATGTRSWYRKIAEESWVDIQNGGSSKQLREWILKYKEDLGSTYFEVHILVVTDENNPYWATA